MNATRYALIGRRTALGILCCAACFTALCLSRAPRATVFPERQNSSRASDVDIYRKVVERVHRGEAYYAALGSELRFDQRPTTSVLNWRTPLHLQMLSVAPNPEWLRVPTTVVAVFAVFMGLIIMNRHGTPIVALLNALLMVASLLLCFGGPGPYFVEVWAGLMIVVSIEAYAFGWWKAGFAAGLLALFLRELALPYLAISSVLAFRYKRRPEMVAWGIGLVTYLLFFCVHAAFVLTRISPNDISNPSSWLQFGGVQFLIMTSSMGTLLMALPPWLTAVYLPAALLGLGGWTDPVAIRLLLTVMVYLGAFAVFGHPGNIYWGAMYAPLLAFGAAWSFPAIRDLIVTVSRRPKTPS